MAKDGIGTGRKGDSGRGIQDGGFRKGDSGSG